jgi:hypothetical protein
MCRRIVVLVVVLCLVFLATGCQAGALKTRKVLPEWSRAQQLGVAALNRPIHMVAEDESVHLIWIDAEANAPHYVRLDGRGEVEVSTDLNVQGSHPSDAKLWLNADGSVMVLWTDNPQIPRALFAVRIDRDGQLLSGPTQVSPEGVRVSDYTVARDVQGRQHLFWANEIPSEGGVHHVRFSADGEVASVSRLLVANGEHPAAEADASGVIHLSWVEEPIVRLNYVYYAVFDPSTDQLGPETQVAVYKTATGLVSYPPILGLDEDTVYLFWSLEQRGGGLTPGESKSYYVAFPLGNPREIEPIEINIPPFARPEYVDTPGTLPYEQLASASAGWPTSFLYQPATLDGQREELGVFFIAEVATQRQSSKEVAWAIYEDGELKGYQLPTQLGRGLRPTGAIDPRGNVHLAWLNAGGFGRYEVYYASTSDAVKANLDRVTVQDRAWDVLNALWALAPALGFFPPIFLLWGFIPLLWVILFYFIKVEGGLDRRPAQIALVVAVVLYLFSKLFLMPGPLFYAPLQDRFPADLQFIPVIGTVLFTLLVALGAMWFYFRRREYRSLFAAFVIFVFTDAILSLIIYVPRWLAG